MLWIGTIVAVLIFLDLLFVEVRRIFRELKRLLTRVSAYGELPIFAQLAKSERDVERIVTALDALDALARRFQAAIDSVRRYSPKGSSPG